MAIPLFGPGPRGLGPGPGDGTDRDPRSPWIDASAPIAGRHGNRSPSNAPRNAYLTRDDRWVAISASATSIAERVMHLVGRPDIAAKPWFSSAGERVQRAEMIDRPVAQWIRARPLTEVEDAFQAAGAALAPVYDMEQLMQDPHVVARQSVVTIDDEDLGPLKMQNLFFRLSATPGAIRHGGRRLGQDTDQVLADLLDLTGDDLAALRANGVL